LVLFYTIEIIINAQAGLFVFTIVGFGVGGASVGVSCLEPLGSYVVLGFVDSLVFAIVGIGVFADAKVGV